jgi:VWFA-related protein
MFFNLDIHVHRKWLQAAFWCLAAVCPAAAQVRDEPIRIDTDLAAFEVTVTDGNGRPVLGLSRKDFRLFEDGNERPVDFFEPIVRESRSRPLAIVFALDVSGSMTEEEIGALSRALRTFADRLASADSYFAFIAFGMEVKVLQSFTNRPQRIESVFSDIGRDRDGLSTHAYDAVDTAVRMLDRKAPKSIRSRLPRRAVILITDGFPVGDTVSPKTVIERANDADTSVFAVLLPSFSRLGGGRRPLPTLLEASGLIKKTGGQSFYATDRSFEELFRALAAELTSSYVVAYYPDRDGRDESRFRNVRIEVAGGLNVRQSRTRFRLKKE